MELNLVDAAGKPTSILQMGAGERIIVRDGGVIQTYVFRTAARMGCQQMPCC